MNVDAVDDEDTADGDDEDMGSAYHIFDLCIPDIDSKVNTSGYMIIVMHI